MATIQDELLQVLLPHFESQQQPGQDGRCELSLEASVTQLKTKIAALEVEEGLDHLRLDNDNDNSQQQPPKPLLETALGALLVRFVDATVATEATSDLQESVDRVLALIAALAVSYSTEVTSMVLLRAVEFSTVLLERVRGHACVLLGKIASSLLKNNSSGSDDDTETNDLNLIEETLIPRLQDKTVAVRCHAIKAVGCFFARSDSSQVDAETYKELLEALLWNLAHDPSVANRITAVQSAPIHSLTLDWLIARVRDVKAKVRSEALEVLRSKALVTDMKEGQMVELIRSGLTNRCGVTKKAASKMVCSGWMKSVKYDPIAMLKLIGVMDNEAEATQVLQVVMEAARSNDTDLLDELSDPEIRAYRSGIETAAVPIQNRGDDDTIHIQPEQLFFLRVRCKSVLDSKELTSSQKDAITTKLIPEIPVLCEVFETHAKALMDAIENNDEEQQDVESFVCLQLLQLAEVANLNEEGSRRHFAYVMKEALSSVGTPDDIVEGCINALRKVCDRESDMIDSVREIIDALHQDQSNETTDNDEDGDSDEEVDMGTIRLVRILSILTVVLETATSQLSSNPAVKEFARFIVPSVTHTDSFVREAAVGCFGKLGLFTDENTIISEFKPILLEVASCEEEKMEIRMQALLALADWSMLFSECLAPCVVGDRDLSFSQAVRTMMDDTRTAAVCISAEVAAKLLFSGRVCDSEWFAKLLSIFFDPRMADMVEEDDDVKEVGSPVRLQQLLTLFFPAVCMKNDGNAGRDAMMGSIFPLLELVYSKQQPKSSGKGGKKSRKKVAWPVAKMIQYVCAAIDSGKSSNEDDATVVQGQENDSKPEDKQSEGPGKASADEAGAVVLNSTSLLASLQVAEFLAKSGHDLTDTEARALCKFLGAADFDADDEDINNLLSLKRYMEELGMLLTDATSLKYIAGLNDLLAEIEVDDDEESVVSNEGDEEDEELENNNDADETLSESEGDDIDSDGEENEVEPAPEKQMNLSDDLLASLEDCRITENESGATGKENSKKSGRKSNNRKTSTGSNASRSRRSSHGRLSDVN